MQNNNSYTAEYFILDSSGGKIHLSGDERLLDMAKTQISLSNLLPIWKKLTHNSKMAFIDNHTLPQSYYEG